MDGTTKGVIAHQTINMFCQLNKSVYEEVFATGFNWEKRDTALNMPFETGVPDMIKPPLTTLLTRKKIKGGINELKKIKLERKQDKLFFESIAITLFLSNINKRRMATITGINLTMGRQ